jgi:phosphoribosylformylglycinamidine synthase
LVFPGSNCDHDCYVAVRDILRQPVEYIWHEQSRPAKTDCLIVPGGFSYGDYLRTGAIARFSPVMDFLREHAAQGKPVIGICNGFQILLEAGLLPGAMLRNASLHFVCRYVNLRVASERTPFTRGLGIGRILRIPIAHGEGNFYCDPDTLSELHANQQIVFQYATPEGELTAEANPNGSLDNIAGICNAQGNVLGMMPHPERAMEDAMGFADGRMLFEVLLGAAVRRAGARA